jgi:hypothetical protein
MTRAGTHSRRGPLLQVHAHTHTHFLSHFTLIQGPFKNSSTVAYVFVAEGTYLPNRCLVKIRGSRDTQTAVSYHKPPPIFFKTEKVG